MFMACNIVTSCGLGDKLLGFLRISRIEDINISYYQKHLMASCKVVSLA